MRNVAIKRIGLDASGRIRVEPDLSDLENYAYIYRDATSVRWDDATRMLYVLPVDGFTLADEFNQIVRAIEREYGDHLAIGPTTLVNLPDHLAPLLVETK